MVMTSNPLSTARSSKPSPMTHAIGSMKPRPGPTSPCKPKGSAPTSPTWSSSAPSIDSRHVASIGKSSASIVQSPSPAMTRKRTSRMRSSDSPPSAMPSGRPMESFSLQGGRVHPDLEALLALQDKDVAVASCDARLRALEPETLALDEQVAAAERVVAQARAGIQAALDRRDGLEGKIQNYRTMQEQRRQRLEWVRGAKEASTLMAELDLARTVLAKEEAEFMRSGDAVGEAERKTAEAENALQNLHDAQAAQREALAGRRQEIGAERESAVLARERATRSLASELRIPDALAAILVQRGLGSADLAKAFLRPDLERLSDPHCWADMDVALELLARAVREQRPILVHGDYDVDGQCASAMLTRILRSAGATVHPFVPHRIRDGYDFGPAGLAEAQRVGAGLIVTCDCGITAVDAGRAAGDAGIDVIVTDHHLPGDELPPANAVLDPRRSDCQSTDKNLCGTGVAFKLAQALVEVLGLSPNLPLHFLDYVALATIADVVPLVGENRILVRYGLKKLADSRWVGR